MVLAETPESRTRDQQQYFRATTTPETPGDKVSTNVKTTNIDPASYLTEVEGAGEGLFVLACFALPLLQDCRARVSLQPDLQACWSAPTLTM